MIQFLNMCGDKWSESEENFNVFEKAVLWTVQMMNENENEKRMKDTLEMSLLFGTEYNESESEMFGIKELHRSSVWIRPSIWGHSFCFCMCVLLDGRGGGRLCLRQLEVVYEQLLLRPAGNRQKYECDQSRRYK